MRLRADVVVGCDGSFGPSRGAVPDPTDVGADLSLLLARHPRRRRPVDRRADLRLAPGGLRAALDAVVDGVAVLPPGAQRHLARRLVRRPDLGRAGHDGSTWTAGRCRPGRSPTARCCRCGRSSRPRCGTAGCSWPATRRTSSRRPAPRGSTSPSPTSRSSRPRWSPGCARTTPRSPTRYADTALRRVWRCTHFSWWMTTMLHATGDPFDEQLQLSQLRWVTSSEAGADRPRGELRRVADRVLRSARGCSGSGGRHCPGRQRP